MDDLSRVLALRQRRCATLRRAEDAARAKVTAARDRVRSVRQSMDDYAAQIRTLEIDLLTELMRTELKKTDFDAFRETLEAAERRARRLADRLDEATKSLMQAERGIDQARRNRRDMETKTNRISQVHDVIVQDRALAEAQARDAEMDDIAEVLSARRGDA
jgi:chromosome segregation ATPase